MAILIATMGWGGTEGDAQVVSMFGYGGTPDGAACGLPFFFDSVEVLATNKLRFRWSAPPKATDSSQSTDATNLANYVLTNSAGVVQSFVLITKASDDTDVVDVVLAQDLLPDVYSLAINPAIVAASNRPALSPFLWNFEVAEVNQEPISLGAANRDEERILSQFMNPAFRGKKNWGALMAGIATGNATVKEIAQNAQRQLYPITAEGKYLDRRASNLGLQRPTNTGLNDSLFQKLIIAVTNSKLTQESFLRIGEIFYGSEAVRAYAESSVEENYALIDGSTLSFLIDEVRTVDVTFNRADFSILRRAKADEVVAVMNRALQNAGAGDHAIAYDDPSTGGRKIRVFSATKGLRSAIRVTGGTAQPVFGFPAAIALGAGSMPSWDITDQGGGVWRWQASSSTVYNLSQVVVGDYVVIRGYEFTEGNRGSFPITNVHYSYDTGLVQWFEIKNPDGFEENIPQCTTASVLLYRPERRTIYNHPAYFLVSQHDGISRVSMAATTRAIYRSPGNAAYLSVLDSVEIESAVRDENGRVVVTTAEDHGLTEDHQVFIDGMSATGDADPVDSYETAAAGSDKFVAGSQTLSQSTGMTTNTTFDRVLAATVTDLDGDVVFIGGQTEDGLGGFTTVSNVNTFHAARGTDSFGFIWSKDDLSAAAPPIRPLGRFAAILEDASHRNHILMGGGYATSPWQVYADDNFDDQTHELVKTMLRETVLTSAQLSNTQGIKGAIQFYSTVNPSSGESVAFTDGTVTRTYGFGTGGDVTVTIGGSAGATMTNLAAAVNGDGSATFGATVTTQLPPNGAAVVIHEDTVGDSRCGLRAYGDVEAFVVFYGDTSAYANYEFGDIQALPTTDPGARGGFHRKLTALSDQETHRSLQDRDYRKWNTTGTTWSVSAVNLWTVSALSTLPNGYADASAGALSDISANAVLSGGSEDSDRFNGLNIASNKIFAFDVTAESWAQVGSLREARMQHQSIKITDDRLLVIGGRQPATYEIGEAQDFVWWDFDDTPAAAANFTGPVTVARAGNPRPAGKVGWGVQCDTSMVASAGAPQTALNTALLGEYTLSFWMTSAQGTIFHNANTPWVDQADNTLIDFGVDPDDDLFYISWQEGVAGTVHTFKTTQTRTELMPFNHNATYPRYYHVAITKTIDTGVATFTIYVNGVEIDSASGPTPDGGADGTWRFAEAAFAASGFNGDLDHVGFGEDVVLSAAIIKKLYLSQCGVAYEAPTDQEFPVGKVLASTELIYDGGSIFQGSPMAYARYAAGVTVLPDGRVLVAGGIGYRTSQFYASDLPARDLELRSAEIYDPASGIWQPLPDMSYAHSFCTAAYVADENRVYVMGGFNSRKIEYLDLATMRWGVSLSELPAIKAHAQGGISGDIPVLAGGDTLLTTGFWQTIASDSVIGVQDEIVVDGGINNVHQVVEVLSPTEFVIQDHDHQVYTSFSGGLATSLSATDDPTAIGPYIFSPKEGVEISEIVTTLVTDINAGAQYNEIEVTPTEADLFPDENGYIVFQFGFGNQVGPVKYLGRTSPNTLSLDGSFVFPQGVEIGSTVRYLYSKAPFDPEDTTELGAFWITSSSSGRAAASELILLVSAAGIELDAEVRYSSDVGIGNQGRPTSLHYKLSDIVRVFGGDNLDREMKILSGELT